MKEMKQQDNERNVQNPLQEFSQEPFQESPQEESPQEPFQEFPEPFQEPPQGLTKNPLQKSLPKKKIILKKQKHIQYFNTWDPQYPTKVVCKKCNHTYSKSTGINTLKEHLKKVHEEMLVRDQALVERITVDLQPFSVATNDQFLI
ncbi:unnamed protein product [Rhizophagus irregularis]|nr:unnamed protein product [Rhizophagus irregularis]